MVDERSSPSKGWQEVNAIMTEGGLSETDELITFHQSQADSPSYEEDTQLDDAQEDVTQYSDDGRYDTL